MDLENKVALITGAGSGIGRAVALAYARAGARVIVSDIAEEGGLETVRLAGQATPAAKAVFVRGDASNPEDHEALLRAEVDPFGAIHIACNKAGIGGDSG